MDKEEFADYIDMMIDAYEIAASYGRDFAEAKTKYIPGVVEYGDNIYEAVIAMCNTIEFTEEITGRKLYKK